MTPEQSCCRNEVFIFKHIENDLNIQSCKKFGSFDEGNAELLGARGHKMLVKKKKTYCIKVRTNAAVKNNALIPRFINIGTMPVRSGKQFLSAPQIALPVYQ